MTALLNSRHLLKLISTSHRHGEGADVTLCTALNAAQKYLSANIWGSHSAAWNTVPVLYSHPGTADTIAPSAALCLPHLCIPMHYNYPICSQHLVTQSVPSPPHFALLFFSLQHTSLHQSVLVHLSMPFLSACLRVQAWDWETWGSLCLRPPWGQEHPYKHLTKQHFTALQKHRALKPPVWHQTEPHAANQLGG